jgi:HK97 family phage major capsid protein
MHPDDYAELAALASTDGELVFPALQENPPTLFGRPVLVDAAMPTPAASGKSLLFGDMAKAYAIRRVRGVGLQRLDEIRSDNGQVTFRSNERLDGKPTLAAAAIIGQHSAT